VELIGMLDSPFVRRVAVTARFLEIQYEHNPLSIFKGYDEFRDVNSLVKRAQSVIHFQRLRRVSRRQFTGQGTDTGH
jgi:hypothetical protein